MTKAEEILKKYPSVKLGLDDHYGRQTVLNALNESLRIHDVVGQSELLAFMHFISKTPQNELELYSDEELVDGYLKANCG
jgi:hypothetical protein